MKICNFSDSLLTSRIDWDRKPALTQSHIPPFKLNNARIQLECRCGVTERGSETHTEYVMGASCKTERVGVSADIWTKPNADFAPVFSKDEYLIVKTWDTAGKNVMLYPPSLGVQPERQSGKVEDAFDDVRINIKLIEGRALEGREEIIQATLDNRTLVGRTKFGDGSYRVVLEYPVKTINVNERDGIYQTDTGPILFPDLSRKKGKLIEGFRLAFVAFNGPDWAEFILQVPTPVGEGISVYHYCESRRLETKNSIVEMSK